MPKFHASVKYDDWTGTVAADDADQQTIRKLLQEKNLYDQRTEFLIGIKLWIGENQSGQVNDPYITCFFTDNQGYDNVLEFLKKHKDPIPLRAVDLRLTALEFLGLLKRFEIAISWKDLPLEGREYYEDPPRN